MCRGIVVLSRQFVEEEVRENFSHHVISPTLFDPQPTTDVQSTILKGHNILDLFSAH